MWVCEVEGGVFGIHVSPPHMKPRTHAYIQEVVFSLCSMHAIVIEEMGTAVPPGRHDPALWGGGFDWSYDWRRRFSRSLAAAHAVREAVAGSGVAVIVGRTLRVKEVASVSSGVPA